MSDRFYNDIQIPDVPEGQVLPNPQPGFIQLFGRDGKLVAQNSDGDLVTLEPGQAITQTQLNIDGGKADTTFQNYLLRLDFGANGAIINPAGTP